ncbi:MULTISPECIES: hypothetical protein [unclassified Sinorhizobium]|uniref:hypothetical protein n=1 Tax=unclassified Sinorhizobium TaxID=2613772 RepID=UPI003523FE70
MAPVILVTFAGRQKRMEILTRYIHSALDAGIIDEWHVWDFTRSQQDHEWVTAEFGPVRYMGSAAPYQFVRSAGLNQPLRFSATITNDLHIAIVPHDSGDDYFELVVGGWSNSHSVLRKLPRSELKSFNRNDVPAIWSKPTPGILSPGTPNQIVLNIDAAGVPSLHVNNVAIGRWTELDLSAGASVMVRGGWGAGLELDDTRSRIQRFVGNPNEDMPYWQAYDFYARRLKIFSDSIFLKCDDDIVYMNLEKLSDFIEFRRTNPKYLVVSANVVNNGVCAHWQQVAGSIPERVGHFEYPPGGFGGSLWLSAERANELHDYFLQTDNKHLPLPSQVIEWTERQSINFIAWLGRDLVHMALPKGDDERALTVDLPMLLERPTAIYSDFTVSHLSFGPQEKGLALDRLIQAYDELMRNSIAA